MIRETFEISVAVPRRTKYEVLASLVEEVGELATEVAIEQGYSKKEQGKDGIIGEAVDVITCALDLIWISSPNVTDKELEDEIMRLVKKKLQKWRVKKGV